VNSSSTPTKYRFPSLVLVLLLSVGLELPIAHATEVQFSGSPVQGGIVFGKATSGAKVFLNNEPLPITAEGHFVFGFPKDAERQALVEVALPDGEVWSQSIAPKVRTFQVQRIDGLEPSKVTPPEEVMTRIQQEAELARTARSSISELEGFREDFMWPVQGRLTGVYGAQRILNGQPRAPHWGVDIAAPTGTPVHSPASGRVVLVHPDMYFSGGTVFIDHGHGLMSAFLHLDQINVEEGQQLSKGDAFATVGETGRATGPHLDWRVSWRDIRVDAQLLVPPL